MKNDTKTLQKMSFLELKEKINQLEMNYDSGSRSNNLIKELFSLYIKAADHYTIEKNPEELNKVKKKYQNLLENPHTSELLEIKNETNSDMHTYSSTQSDKNLNEKYCNSNENNNFEKKILKTTYNTNNKQNVFKNFSAKIPFQQYANNTKFGSFIKIKDSVVINNKNILKNQDFPENGIKFLEKNETNLQMNTKNLQNKITGSARKNEIHHQRSKYKERARKSKKSSLFSGNKSRKSINFRQKENYLKKKSKKSSNEDVENEKLKLLQIYENSLLDIKNKVSEDIDKQITNFKENLSAKKSFILNDNPDYKNHSIPKFIIRKSSTLFEIYKRFKSGEEIIEDDIYRTRLEEIENKIITGQTCLNQIVERIISENFEEMNDEIEKIESIYESDIKEFEDGGELYTGLVKSLKEELNDKINEIRRNYDYERQRRIKDLKSRFFSSIQFPEVI